MPYHTLPVRKALRLNEHTPEDFQNLKKKSDEKNETG